ncbi:MAG: uncharacterized protein OJF60_000707 [Burkholderiaceae bacterium]|jgi:arsenate reductase|nr:MAG: uncharacterized protein OJF60_000707 [Burkholderiaceae bacterium]
MSRVTIYHNPRCSTSRTVLGLLREHGIEPDVVDYLKHPLDRSQLVALTKRLGVPVRDVVRTKEALYRELGLDDPTTSDDALLDAIAAHPILLNRPIVVTARGARLCRPADSVLELLAR